MADEKNVPAGLLKEVSKGVDLQEVDTEEKNSALARDKMLLSIKQGGVIATPEERAPKSNTEALARAALLNTINRSGVISTPSEHTPKAGEAAVARAALLNVINRSGVVSVPSEKAPESKLDKEAMLKQAELEKAQLAQWQLHVTLDLLQAQIDSILREVQSCDDVISAYQEKRARALVALETFQNAKESGASFL